MLRKPTNMIQAQMITELVSTTDTSSTGALVDSSSAYNINDGEVALLSSDLDAPDYGQLTATPDGQLVKLVQGTPASADLASNDPWGVSDPSLIETDSILKDGVRSITVTNYNSGALAVSAYTNLPDIVADSDYGIILQLGGVRQEREFGTLSDQPTGDYLSPSELPTAPKDAALQSIAFKLNSMSRLTGGTKNFVILGINTTGGSGTALSSIVNDGSQIDFEVRRGITYRIKATSQLVRGLANLIEVSDTITGATTIEVLDVTKAGDAQNIDGVLAIGLDAVLAAYEDEVIELRTDVDLNPKDQFESEGTVEKAYPSEGEGSGRALQIDSRHRAQLQIHTKQNTPYGHEFSRGYSYLDPKKNYGVCRVDFVGTEAAVDHKYIYEKQAVIYWEQTEPTTLSVSAGAETSAIASYTPSESAPAVVDQLAAWADNVSVVTV